MKRLVTVAILCVPSIAGAGGLFLPGAGAVSAGRAGAAIASTDDGEALAVNPAGLAKAKGTTITLAASIISYAMEFTRRGTYNAVEAEDYPYEGQKFGTVTDASAPKLGFGSYQPVPVIAVVTDLGGAIPGLHLALGLYAPNAYPFRDMSNGYKFNGSNPGTPPPPSRYDILKQDGAVLLPSIAAAYRITDQLDVGARFSAGYAKITNETVLWGSPNNIQEDVKADALFHAEATDSFIPTFGLGITYRPTPNIELAATYDYKIDVKAQGRATSANGPSVSLSGNPLTIGPGTDDRCAPGGTFESQTVCIRFGLPQKATVGGRYKFLDHQGSERGDVELNVGWEGWSKRCDGVKDFLNGCVSPSTYFVQVNAAGYIDSNKDGQVTADEAFIDLKDNYVEHRFKDTYNARLGGSYQIPLDPTRTVIVRGGVGYDTRAAETGWFRSDIDGAARLMTSVGASYKTRRLEVSAGLGGIFEGSFSNPGTCNPPAGSTSNPNPGCSATGTEQKPGDRNGPDPISPITTSQTEHPIAQGDYKSHYIVGMLGVSTWF